ncbi:peptidoglycan recognition protein family protein [Paenibacillus harenae]|uniref:peptidoglycan recognition protein family protein n=1 Tax=Paenibacillus harenae TaxID=306543 RepID=UPI000413AE6F|nr:N-acetylmuramoyl-L-alanine amidase [Paenibacillus harenae]
MTQWILPKILPNNLAAVPVIDLRGKLPVNPNGGWTVINPPRNVEALTDIVMHHDALSKSSTAKYTDEQLIQNISTTHINSKKNRSKGDGGFPYHLFIRNGKLYICNDLTDFTYGVASNNGYTVHISVSGNYAGNDVLNDADRAALYMAYYIAKSSMPAFKELRSHGEMTPTACPGYSMDKVRSDISEIELSMELNDNLQGQLLNAAALETRVKDLYKKASNPGKNQFEAIRKLSRVADIMRAEGLL